MAQFNQQGHIVYVTGCLTQSDVAQIWSKRHQLFTRQTQVLDLSALAYTDSAGIALLLSFITLTDNKEQHGNVKLIHPSPQLLKMIELYDLSEFFQPQ
ncbi:lipid asymmetry maintenance protein MlaB [Shewanella intestini]|uniref:STAS domain-containing protein n=1 Tax=Shewanella intestini TaxID=2017544 RepID=A0ABS5I0T2_9GAMM|nr:MULTISPECIES: STAS domain-containing protein [Shewanella]MBR9727633.1 STAS domain-containing protein [Shewanella intestini]MRG35217.1 STAS domain-containing protein [Shewanella sp. XMDDZSB0408]